jgi:uncharacterized protein with FMN-binding domain
MKLFCLREAGHVVFALSFVLAVTACGVRNELREMNIEGIDLSAVSDGTYIGEYGRSRWLYVVDITVKDHEITNIEILKGAADGGLGSKKLNESLIKAALEFQDNVFDAVSGASVNTKVFQRAVENAFAETAPDRG